MNNNFNWFIGVVEDINDPRKCGRVRVRCFGYHSPSIQDIPIDTLPWASVMMPVTSASISGIGQSPTGIVQGVWVVGFFRDGDKAQDPIIMGTLPSYSTMPNPEFGFRDPDGVYPTTIGNDIPKEAYLYSTSNTSTVKGAGFSALGVSDIGAPTYPNNQVIKTESGHCIEVDDTSGKTRISVMHKDGSFFEMDEGGKVYIYAKDIMKIATGSNCNISVNGNAVVNATGDVDVSGTDVTVTGSTSVTLEGASDGTIVLDNTGVAITGTQITLN